MQKIIFAAAILLASCQGIQVSQALQKQRGQLGWRQEVTNNFTWNATQELNWSVVNAFIDVQTSPEGDIFAIQKISSDVSDTKYHLYNYNISSNIWSLVNSSFQVKAVRFDRLGNIYYLDPENCVRNSEKVKLICGLSDFEVTVNKEILGLHDGSNLLQTDNLQSTYKAALVSPFKYKAITGFKGITLLRDEPIFIANDGTVDAKYGGEKLISISAGIDGSLWALLDEENAVDYTVLKWQTITQKWYKVDGAKGVSLSAYNEISVAIVDSKGLLSLSSQVGHQNEADYTASVVQPPTNPPVSVRPDITSFTSNLATFDDFKWLSTVVPGKNFSRFEQKFHSQFGGLTRESAINAIANIPNLFMIYKTNYSAVTGFYLQESLPATNETLVIKPNYNVIYSITNRVSFVPTTKNITYYQNEDITKHFIVLSDKAALIFQPHCGSYNNGQSKDNFFEMPPNENQNRVMSTTLTGNPSSQLGSENVACVEIEYYQGII
ncbi:UNKNOWN [Stylonychia lemnae]|uniref:TLDc domain-containing protein n=1 Tax=Stylonychia lemnae TaxID=5949 RepID=A0A078AGV2_STYLE|nr:UNKNOWN [Stylonychia lemnae]|eukprot:CDW81076.1 UNKNOWN [Stylonychia lemnae]